jgi:glycosyltransferase involved in cell wall biosynthesis
MDRPDPMPPGRVSVLALGQVPPPHHGQAVMISTWLDGAHPDISIDFLPMRYSTSVEEVGRLSLKKVFLLIDLLLQAVRRLSKGSIDVVYYPPTGAGRIPLVRDILTLLILRRFRRPIVYHFHAMGLAGSYGSLGRCSKWLFRLAFQRPDLCICVASSNLAEVAFLEPAKTTVIPYGIPDWAPTTASPYESIASPAIAGAGAGRARTPIVLFLGNLIPSKGVWRLLRLASRFGEGGIEARVVLVGAPTDARTMAQYHRHAAAISGRATFVGPRFGEEKEAWLRSAAVFCFPTSYESENFPVVLLEALRAGLPIVSTNWRGIPEIVEEGTTGYLVEPEDEGALYDRVCNLLGDDRLRLSMGQAARASYLQHFTASEYVRRMDRALREAGTKAG